MKTVLLLAPIVLASAALAQTNISGTISCPKPEQMQSVTVGDRPNHEFVIVKLKCSWSKPIEMEGVQTTGDESAGFSEVLGSRLRERGYDVVTMANGDKVYVSWSGAGTMKEGAPQGAEGKWRFIGGTGKFKRIKGTGTYKNSAAADGSSSAQIEGNYSLSKPAAAAK